MNNKQILLLIVLCCFLVSPLMHINAQVTIGSLQEPNRGAILDLKEEGSTSRGLGMPRVMLKDLNKLIMGDNVIEDEDMAWEKHAGLLVYNMNRCIDKSGEGLYVWKGNEWESLSNQNQYERDALYQPNTYMVDLGTPKVQIPVEKAFRIWEYYGSADGANRLPPDSVTGTLTPVLYWQDAVIVPSSGSLSISSNDRKGIITVNLAGGTVKGNAVVGLQDGSGTIRWSWHIWVTDDTTIAGLNGGGYTWMDRNLGATSATAGDIGTIGLVYQWGRKDPFPMGQSWVSAPGEPTLQSGHGELITAVEKLSKNETSSQDNFKNSIYSPLVYIYIQGSYSYDWYSASTDDLWNNRWDKAVNNCFAKSPLDPCPKGWKVPTHMYDDNEKTIPRSGPWEALISGEIVGANIDNKARTWDTYGVFPLSGIRQSNTTTISQVMTYAYIWSASGHASLAHSSYAFYYGRSMAQETSISRSYGFSVRCVKE